MKKYLNSNWIFFIGFLFVFIICSVPAGAEEGLKIVKLLPSEDTAIVKMADGKLKAVGIGDKVSKFGKVIQISDNRLIFEADDPSRAKLIILEMVEGRQQTIQIGEPVQRTTMVSP